MYYIASLAKFGNCCSMVWARRLGKWKDKTIKCFLFRGGGKRHCCTISFRTGFSIPTYYNSFGYWKLLHTSKSCCSDNLAQLQAMLRPLKSGVRQYISLRMNFFLYMWSVSSLWWFRCSWTQSVWVSKMLAIIFPWTFKHSMDATHLTLAWECSVVFDDESYFCWYTDSIK